MTKPNAGSTPSLPVSNLCSTAAQGSKKINSWPQSPLCLTQSGSLPNDNNDSQQIYKGCFRQKVDAKKEMGVAESIKKQSKNTV